MFFEWNYFEIDLILKLISSSSLDYTIISDNLIKILE